MFAAFMRIYSNVQTTSRYSPSFSQPPFQVWISWTEFEVSIGDLEKSRSIYKRGNTALESSPSEERLLLLESWKQFEEKHGDETSFEEVEKLMPKRIKKRRPIQSEDGTDAGWEEYYEYIFPADQGMLEESKE